MTKILRPGTIPLVLVVGNVYELRNGFRVYVYYVGSEELSVPVIAKLINRRTILGQLPLYYDLNGYCIGGVNREDRCDYDIIGEL